MQSKKYLAQTLIALCLILFPFALWAQHPEPHLAEKVSNHPESLLLVFEWIEFIADIAGITILLIGFVKGCYMFIRLEFDRLTGRKDAEEVFQLRSILGSYIIVSLDFLIVSDIIHSVISPQMSELLNLGIIVVLRTAIGFFLGRELMELRKEQKLEESLHEEAEH